MLGIIKPTKAILVITIAAATLFANIYPIFKGFIEMIEYLGSNAAVFVISYIIPEIWQSRTSFGLCGRSASTVFPILFLDQFHVLLT